MRDRVMVLLAILFVGLNVADAWLTEQLLTAGGGEANPLVSAYGSKMLIIKGFLALAIALLLVRFGKSKLLFALNLCMVVVVLWTWGWLLTYL